MKKVNLENVQLKDEEEAPLTAEEEADRKKNEIPEMGETDPSYSGVVGYEPVTAEAEKVSVVDIGEQARSNSRDQWPSYHRSAFYVQISEEDGGLWRF